MHHSAPLVARPHTQFDVSLIDRPIDGQTICLQHSPLVETRAPCGYVGLSNCGNTCYANAVVQQLLMVPRLTEKLLRIRLDIDSRRASPTNPESLETNNGGLDLAILSLSRFLKSSLCGSKQNEQ